jgi:hypothetical protein
MCHVEPSSLRVDGSNAISGAGVILARADNSNKDKREFGGIRGAWHQPANFRGLRDPGCRLAENRKARY